MPSHCQLPGTIRKIFSQKLARFSHFLLLFSFRYCNVNISEPVRVCVELVKPSDDSRSEEEEFFYTPITNSNMTSLNVKRETVLRNIDNNKMEPVTLHIVYIQ